MNRMSPQEFAGALGSGLLSFPVTHFNEHFDFDATRYREHIEWLLSFRPAGLFAAGGTGEFFSLTLREYSHVIAAAVEQTNHRVPVVAGCGYGTAMAKEFVAAEKQREPTDFCCCPPTWSTPDAAGLTAHVEAVCASTNLGVIFYNRDNAVLNECALAHLCERCPNLVGFKDGVRRHRVDDAYLCAPRRSTHLHRRPAYGRNLRAALP